jgi:methylaspartate mutase epsilon subunit
MPVYNRRLMPARFVADHAPVGGPAVTPIDPGSGHALAVVGTGPRGISILERLGARLLAKRPVRSLTVYAIDADEVGSGRVWRSGQPRWLSMNNRSGEITMFSGPADDGAWRPGAGPTFAEWWQHMDARFPGPCAYAPRSLYGRYLRFVLDVVETNLPPNVDLVRVPGLVSGIEKRGGRFELLVGDQKIACDQVAVCSGHAREQTWRCVLAGWSAGERHQRHAAPHVRDDAGRGVFPGGVTGILGLGLTFHDVVATLTVGRGGRFVGRGRDCEYVPSGAEPDLIVAGSRSALPIPARGVSQRPFDFKYAPRLFTAERIARLKAAGPLDFRADVLPWVEAEVNIAFWRRRLGRDSFALFEQRLPHAPAAAAEVLPSLRQAASELGCEEALSLEDLAHPFSGRAFRSQEEFRGEFMRVLANDVGEAMLGEVDSALKSATEVLRFVRPGVRAVVDFGGLTAESHKDFVEHTGPMLAFLSTGPSVVRSCHLIALMRSGLLEILGPRAEFAPHDGGYVGSSPSVAGYSVFCSDLIDARIRQPDLDRNAGPLARRQRDAGAWRPYVRVGAPAFRTGGVDVTKAPYHPIATDGSVENHMYVLGIPTESTRWFMQVGIGRPGPWGEFFLDADAIAQAALSKIELTGVSGLAEPGGPAGPAGLSERSDVSAHSAEEGASPGPHDMDYCFGPQHPDGTRPF